MKNNRFRYKFNNLILAVTALTAIISLISVILSFLKLSGFGNMKSFSLFIDIFNIIVSMGIIIVLTLAFLSEYVINDNYLVLRISVLQIKIPLKDIRLIRQDSQTQDLCIYYVVDAEKSLYKLLMITINNERKNDFVNTLKKKNDKIIYESVSKEDKD